MAMHHIKLGTYDQETKAVAGQIYEFEWSKDSQNDRRRVVVLGFTFDPKSGLFMQCWDLEKADFRSFQTALIDWYTMENVDV